MFLSETMLRAIHADRVREIERATRQHRLLESGREEPSATSSEREGWRPSSARAGRSRIPA